MFESNFPPDKQSCGYTELWNAFKRITAGASAADKAALYAGTAARVYRLTPAALTPSPPPLAGGEPGGGTRPTSQILSLAC